MTVPIGERASVAAAPSPREKRGLLEMLEDRPPSAPSWIDYTLYNSLRVLDTAGACLFFFPAGGPVLQAAPDLAAMVIRFARGDFVGGAFSGFCAVPILGDFAAWIVKGPKILKTLSNGAKWVREAAGPIGKGFGMGERAGSAAAKAERAAAETQTARKVVESSADVSADGKVRYLFGEQGRAANEARAAANASRNAGGDLLDHVPDWSKRIAKNYVNQKAGDLIQVAELAVPFGQEERLHPDERYQHSMTRWYDAHKQRVSGTPPQPTVDSSTRLWNLVQDSEHAEERLNKVYQARLVQTESLPAESASTARDRIDGVATLSSPPSKSAGMAGTDRGERADGRLTAPSLRGQAKGNPESDISGQLDREYAEALKRNRRVQTDGGLAEPSAQGQPQVNGESDIDRELDREYAEALQRRSSGGSLRAPR